MTPLQALKAIPWRKNREGGKGGPIASYSKRVSDGCRLTVYPSGMWSVRARVTYKAPRTLHGQYVPVIEGPPIADLASDMEENVTQAKRAAERWVAEHIPGEVPFP